MTARRRGRIWRSTLTWRLPGTLAALAAGWIDLDRAEIIARATSVLGEEAARLVEARVLPEARWRTYAELRAWLHQLVIAADPDGAEERRQKAERNANVRLYADDDQTATLVADKLPQIETASGFAKINALARARKAAGLPGSLGLHRAQVLLGLILGTPPPTPPAEDAPPDQPPPPASDPGSHGTSPAGRPDPHGGPGPDELPMPPDELPPPPDEPLPTDESDAAGDGLDAGDRLDGADDGPIQGGIDPWEDDDDLYGTGPAPVWPPLGSLPPGLARPGPADGTPPAAGLLDVTLPWVTLAGLADRPGTLGRIGAITPAQARQLALAAAGDPTAQWRVIVTSPAGHAIAVARIRRPARRRRDRSGSPARDGPPAGPGPAGRLTLTISQDTITALRPGSTGPPARSTAQREGRGRPDRAAGRYGAARRHRAAGPHHRGCAAHRRTGAAACPDPSRSRHRRRRVRAYRRIRCLPATAAAARVRDRPRPHLPQPGLRPACLARRPGPHDPMGTGRSRPAAATSAVHADETTSSNSIPAGN